MNEEPPPDPAAHPADAHRSPASGAHPADDRPASASGAHPADDRPAPASGAHPADDRPASASGAHPADDRPASASGAHPADDAPTVAFAADSSGDRPTPASDAHPADDHVEGGGTPLSSGPAQGGAVPGGEVPPGGFSSGAEVPLGGGVPPGGFPPGGSVPPGGEVPPGGFPPGGSVPPGTGAWRVGPDGIPRRLTRSTSRKVIGGVAGGLGEYTGVDPVLFRVLFAVLTLFGGSGILLYAAGWVLLPADDQPASPVESLIGRSQRGPGRSRDTLVAAALIVAGLVLAGVVAIGDARDLAVCLLVVGGAYFLIRNLNERRQGGPPQPVAPEPPPVAYQAFDTPPPGYQPGGTATITAPAPVTAPRPPKPRREHSLLGVLTLCVLLVAVGVTSAFDNGDPGGPDVQTYLAIATGIIGLGLLVGTFFGRARWLAWLGLPSLALLIVVSTSGINLEGGAGDQVFNPTSASDVQPAYRLGVGSLRIDLSQVDLSEQLVSTKASIGVGNVEIVVPRNADVSVDAHAGIGDVLLFEEDSSGTSVSRSVVDQGVGGDGRIDLVLDLDVNIGQVRVDRAQA